MALTTDQKRKLLIDAKKVNPNLTREQATQILSQAETPTSKPVGPSVSDGDNPTMKILADIQAALGKGGKASAVIPVIGGLTGAGLGAVGGPVGSIAGSAIGAGLAERLQQLLDPNKAITGGEAGEAIKQGDVLKAITGNKEDVQNVLKEGAISGALDTATLGASKILGPIVKQGAKTAGNIVSTPALVKTFQEAFTVPRALSASIRFPEAIKTLIEEGVGGKNIDEFFDISRKVTGKDGVLPQAVRSALGQADNMVVDLGDEAIEKAIKNANKAATNVTDAVKKASNVEIENMIYNSAPEFGKTKPLEAFDLVQNLERKGYALLSQTERSLTDSASNIALEQQAKIYLDAASSIKDKLFSDKTISKEIIEAIKTPEAIETLRQISPKLADKFINAKTIADIRKIQSPYVALGIAAEATANAAQSPFSQFLKSSGKGGLNISVPGVQQIIEGVSSAVKSPQARTGMAILPQQIKEAVSTQNIVSGVRSLVSPEGTKPVLTRELISQLLSQFR